MEKLLHHLWMLTKHSLYGLIIQLFLSTTLLAVESNAQRYDLKKIQLTVNLNGKSVTDALKQLETQTEFRFTYNKYDLDKLPVLSGKFTNKSLYEILSAIGTQSGLYFKQVNENISVGLKKKNEEQIQRNKYSFQVTGRVTSQDDQSPLPGVNIFVKGTTAGTTTAADGTYSLEVPDEKSILVFSFIGYQTIEEVVGSRSVIDISLASDVTSLSEVVVVGYGTQKKSDLTGAVSIADPEEMTKQATNDVTQMMQGRIAGVAITSDGQAGATPSVRVRGVSTFGSGGTTAEPLYVVDGYPLPPGGIRDVNPNDIETMQVLKDATAGAIYGNRGANGVVIITTKTGKKNQDFSIGLNTYYGLQKVPQRLPVLDREGYQLINSELLTNAGRPLVPGNDPNSPDYIDDIDTDWQDAGYQDGYIANVNINLSGGTEKTNYFMSMDYMDNKGTLVGTGPDYKRYSFRVNSETQLGRFKVGENIMVMRSDEHPLFFTTTINLPGGRPTLVNDLLQAAPTIPVNDPNREGGFGGADAIIHQSITLNVPGFNTLVENSTVVNRVLAGAYAEVDLIEGLSYRLNLQYDNTDITDELFVPEYDLGYFFPNPTAQYQVGNRSISSSLIENTLTYKRKFGKHDLTLLAGQSFQDFDYREVRTAGSGLQKPYVRSLASASTFSVTDNQQPAAISSYLGRVNYSFDDRYLITFNIRRDGSSKFSEDNRFDIFPSVGVAWKIHNDFTMPGFISELKLRGGIGEVGNQEIGNFRYQSTINRSIPYEYSNGRVLGAATTTLVDPSIQWETRTTRNVAIDAVLFDRKLEFTAEYYSNTSDDVLLGLPPPLTAGSLSDILINGGSIENTGIELSATYHLLNRDFTLDIAPNFYTVNNEILSTGTAEFFTGTGSRNQVGHSLGEHYGWVYDGIFQTQSEIDAHEFQNANTAPGDIIYRNLNDDDLINDADRQFLGKGMPTYYYGLNVTAGYKGFDFTLFLSGSGGNLINSNLYRGLMPTSGYTNWHEDILNRWTTENPNTTVPRVIWNDPNNNGRDSNRPDWLQKGDYLRINTISLGYTLPAGVLNKVKMKSARVYATVQNVHTFASYKGYNPDFQAGILNPGFDYGTYPRPITTMLGLQLKF